jgi:hypothetical protein
MPIFGWQFVRKMNPSGNHFSLTLSAPRTDGRAENQILISNRQVQSEAQGRPKT